MTKKKQKFYVVWQGRNPGVYTSWNACQAEINGVSGAKYKSFESRSDADRAFFEDASRHWGVKDPLRKSISAATPDIDPAEYAELGVDMSAWCVDAACKGNPGILEYQGMELASGVQLFQMGPYPEGTVNIGEFLAIVHALALLDHAGQSETKIYSDSRIAISWVKQGVCKTKLPRSSKNQKLFNLVDRAEKWLATHAHANPVVKWETKLWGENPADFGRK